MLRHVLRDSYNGGESMIRFCQRIYNLLDDIKKESDTKVYLLVAHNGVARLSSRILQI